ncbi:DUF427 domain-containing protein [Specibacter cremeus]|uniref:DUF427 domain-containing protein n=1 Tax=Specibacter cremeus TaxID=1629051 RepID=UPI0013DDE2E6|nr:DUF427 domain-containing protein [Specibacter cremeus]
MITAACHATADGQRPPNAAWSHPLPSPLAWRIKNKVAFSPFSGIRIENDRT